MRVHIIGVGGTFMAGVAIIADQLGFEVSGCDQSVYPPMSNVLAQANISVVEGYDQVSFSQNEYDVVVVGNAISRGNPALEQVLNAGLHYMSGPEFLAAHVLRHKHVIAVAGTHGKTTTTSLLAWLLSQGGYNPGFLIGGAANNFATSACVTDSPYFVIEADEYDTAFFDKRPKFMHYRPRTLVLTNLEFDHADIFTDLNHIQQQFGLLLRCVPEAGTVIANQEEHDLQSVLSQGCWSQQHSFGLSEGDWQARLLEPNGSVFEVYFEGQCLGTVCWSLLGAYNVKNALAAIAAAHSLGMPISVILSSLRSFSGVKCRMEMLSKSNGVQFIRDFAHHPTSIKQAIDTVRMIAKRRLMVVLQLGSRTLQRHVDVDQLATSLAGACQVLLMQSDEVRWDLSLLEQASTSTTLWMIEGKDVLLSEWAETLLPGDTVLMLSNKDMMPVFNQMRQSLLA